MLNDDIDQIEKHYGDHLRSKVTRDEWHRIKSFIEAQNTPTNKTSVPGLVRGTGIYIDLPCPYCNRDVLANVTLQMQS